VEIEEKVSAGMRARSMRPANAIVARGDIVNLVDDIFYISY
jgi:hypothetical protein